MDLTGRPKGFSDTISVSHASLGLEMCFISQERGVGAETLVSNDASARSVFVKCSQS